jgi:Zn-dependent protease with chaperone function
MPWTWAWDLASEGAGVRPPFWEGAARFYDGKEAKAREIPVAIGLDGLEVRAGEAAGWYRRGDLDLADHNHDHTFFSLDLKPREGAVLAFHDQPEAMEWLRSAGLLGRSPLAGMSLRGKALALLAFLAVLSAFIYLVGLDLMVEGAVRALPRKVDRLLGASVIKAFAKDTVAVTDSLAARALARSRDRVQALAGAAGTPGDAGETDTVRILIVRDSSVKNAFAFPGGYIVVYTGMLGMLESQEEWMGLLAHEGAHIHLRHGIRRVVRGGILGVGASLILGDASGIGSVLLDNAGTLMNLSYGRRDESEADAFAERSLERAGHSAAGLVTLFEKLLALQALPAWAAFVSTHPATEARIASLKGAKEGPQGLWLSRAEWEALKRL